MPEDSVTCSTSLPASRNGRQNSWYSPTDTWDVTTSAPASMRAYSVAGELVRPKSSWQASPSML